MGRFQLPHLPGLPSVMGAVKNGTVCPFGKVSRVGLSPDRGVWANWWLPFWQTSPVWCLPAFLPVVGRLPGLYATVR